METTRAGCLPRPPRRRNLATEARPRRGAHRRPRWGAPDHTSRARASSAAPSACVGGIANRTDETSSPWARALRREDCPSARPRVC